MQPLIANFSMTGGEKKKKREEEGEREKGKVPFCFALTPILPVVLLFFFLPPFSTPVSDSSSLEGIWGNIPRELHGTPRAACPASVTLGSLHTHPPKDPCASPKGWLAGTWHGATAGA